MEENQKYKARLELNKDKFELRVLKKEEDSGKVIYKNEDILNFIKKLLKEFEYTNVDALLSASRKGDPFSYRFSLDLAGDKLISMDAVKEQIENFDKMLDAELPYKVKHELRSNMFEDLSASIMEQLSEKLAYEIFHQMDELAIDTLEVVADELEHYPQIIDVIGKNANIIKIDVDIISRDSMAK